MNNDAVAAMRELSQKQTNSIESFITGMQSAYNSGNRIVLTRTREPFRLVEALTDYTRQAGTIWKHWDTMRGWVSYEENTTNEELIPMSDGMDNFQAALEVVDFRIPTVPQLNPAKYTEPFNDSGAVYLMMYPQPAIADGHTKNIKSIQCIKHYAMNFPYKDKMLIFAVPEDFKCPIELEDDMVMIDFDLPSVNERFDTIVDTLADIFGEHFEEDAGGADAVQFDYWASVLNASSGLTMKNFQDYFTDALIISGAEAIGDLDVEAIAVLVNRAKTDIIKRSDVLEIMPSESMANVGGQDLLKKWVNSRKHAFSQTARSFGVDAPRGVMLVGPPGTGKSVAAKAIAGTLSLPLIRFDVSRVFNSLVGSSEARIRSALKLVDALEPCVLFVDEVDKVFQQGSGGTDSGISTRVLGTLLTWMQETKSQVFIVMTANRTVGLPPEMLRKGRLDEIFSVTTPSAEEIKEIAQIHLRKRGHEGVKLDYDKIAKAADGYVPAEIECAIKEAILFTFNTNLELDEADHIDITEDAIISELELTTPLSKSFKEDFEEMEKWASDNARPASSNPRSQKKMKVENSKRSRRRVGGSVKESDSGVMAISSH